jgi:hypothetical protein
VTPPPPAETAPPLTVTPDAERGAERVNLHVPRILQQQLVDHPEAYGWTVDAAGFANLCQQLAWKRREDAR